MWSSVCKSCSSSAFLLIRSSISCCSRNKSRSARLTAASSWALINCITWERLLSMVRMSWVKILSVSSTAACAECCQTHITISTYCCLTQPERHSELQWEWMSNSPFETSQRLSAPEADSVSPEFPAGTFFVFLPKASVGKWKGCIISDTKSVCK